MLPFFLDESSRGTTYFLTTRSTLQGESLRAVFTKLYQSFGIADASYADPQESLWPRHACQATLWIFAGTVQFVSTTHPWCQAIVLNSRFLPGVESLAQTHENFVIAFTEPGEDESRFCCLVMRARRASNSNRRRSIRLALSH